MVLLSCHLGICLFFLLCLGSLCGGWHGQCLSVLFDGLHCFVWFFFVYLHRGWGPAQCVSDNAGTTGWGRISLVDIAQDPCHPPHIPPMPPHIPLMSPHIPPMPPHIPPMPPHIPLMSPHIPLMSPHIPPMPPHIPPMSPHIPLMSPHIPHMSPHIPLMSPHIPLMSPHIPLPFIESSKITLWYLNKDE